jgi:hypothetical protein
MSYYDRDNDDAQPSMKWPKPHHGSTAEYGTSGWPFVATGQASSDITDVTEIDFKYVTRWVQITNTDTTENLALSFADPVGEAPATYYTLKPDQISPRFELKCTKLFISSSPSTESGTPTTTDYTLIAGLTSIDKDDFPDISVLDGVAHTS